MPFLVVSPGKDEGAFAWLTLNYLLGKLDSGDVTQTIAAIDLGGGSVQEAFALTDAAAAKAPKEYLAKLRSSGKALNVYVHSYLGYGLMAGRAKVLEAHAAGTPHACVPSGSASKYVYAGKDYTFVAEKVASFSGCETDAVTALDLAKPCSAPQVCI